MTAKILADKVLKNGVVYTADEKDQVCEAVAIQDSRILFVGSNEDVQVYMGPNTEQMDLQGKFVMPGMIDSHIHPPGLSLLELYEVQLSHLHSVTEYVEAVREFLAQHPKASAVYGRGWSWGVLTGDELVKGPRKEYLDAVTKELPIILRASDGHTLWVNSKALAVNGVDERTVVPTGGVITTDSASGELWGTLKEAAMRLIALPEYRLEQYIAAMIAFQNKMHRYGITAVQCFSSLLFQTIFAACEEMERRGQLQLRIRGAVTISPEEELEAQLDTLEQLREQYQTDYLQVTATKFFTDGVIEGGTSYLLQPYTLQAGKGENYYGSLLWEPEKLQQAFLSVNKRAFSIHVHSTGDASTKAVLDALTYAHDHLPFGDYRNTITHLQLVDHEDIPRFKELQVIASVQPYWHFKGPNWWQNVDQRLLGNRANKEFPLGTFFASHIKVASSSDYPATLVPNPLLAIDIGVTRNIDYGPSHGVADITDKNDPSYLLNKQERATVQQMIKSFTINGAYMLFIDHQVGSIEAGKCADLVVLDDNLLTMNPSDIDKAKVVMTFFNGKLVYEQPVL